MSIGSAGKHRNDFDDSEFGAFFDRPFHAVEFENGEEESDLDRRDLREFFTQVELHPVFVDVANPAPADGGTGRDVEFLAPDHAIENIPARFERNAGEVDALDRHRPLADCLHAIIAATREGQAKARHTPLALGELEAAAGLGLAVLLTFDHA